MHSIKYTLISKLKHLIAFNYFKLVPRAGLEPAQPKGRGILNPLCLPISPPGLNLEARPGVEPSYTDLQSGA